MIKKIVLNRPNPLTEISVSEIDVEQHHYFYVYNKIVWKLPYSKDKIFESLKTGQYDEGDLYQITSVEDFETLKKRYPMDALNAN